MHARVPLCIAYMLRMATAGFIKWSACMCPHRTVEGSAKQRPQRAARAHAEQRHAPPPQLLAHMVRVPAHRPQPCPTHFAMSSSLPMSTAARPHTSRCIFLPTAPSHYVFPCHSHGSDHSCSPTWFGCRCTANSPVPCVRPCRQDAPPPQLLVRAILGSGSPPTTAIT